MTSQTDSFLARCLSIDLEVDPKTARLFAFGALRGGETLAYRAGPWAALDMALDRLEAFSAGATHLVGHNILRHDLPHLAANRARLAGLGAAAVDTLWLNPLAFPRNPYHHLVKHYQDGRLEVGHVNDPVEDARLAMQLLSDQIAAFARLGEESPDTLAAWHHLTTRGSEAPGFDALFQALRGPAPGEAAAHAAIRRLLTGQACNHRLDQTLERLSDPQNGWPMAYALAWISVAGGASVMPPWVRLQFPQAARIVRHLRDTNCGDPACAWCREGNDPGRALERWFGFPAFRPEPVDPETRRPLQERIVAEAMAGKSVLGILPTGTGKSVCYQIPALSRFDRTGALTVVISPLVALMADQVQGMARAGISCAVTVNGMLSLPERHDALEKVRMGDAAMLLISPEQLRSPSVRSVLHQREVGLWVLDEAHCISQWGHDFRPDYRYVSRFIRESSGDSVPPVLCLTATAKPEVVRDIRDHFQTRVGVDLMLLDGGAVRTNLHFDVMPTQKATKLSDILTAIEAHLPSEGGSGAIVYCATRATTERVAGHLKAQGLAADHFHAGLEPERKREVQEAFRTGQLRVIAATNAFGMGIDKPDIRLVVHADIPGSLENYLQEAGRAGRDRAPARCVLLYDPEDVERQFSLSARSRLARHEIGAILKALRRMEKHKSGEVVATPGEIVREEKDQAFERDRQTDDTRVKTAVAWLEEATLLSREENRVMVFPSALRIRTVEDAAAILDRPDITGARKKQLLDLVRHVMNAAPDAGVSTDDLIGATGLAGKGVAKALADLEALGIARNDTAITVYLHLGVEDASTRRLEQAARLETDLIELMQEAAPDAQGSVLPLHLTETCQALRDRGHVQVRPDLVETILRSMAQDGRDHEGKSGSLTLRKLSRNSLSLRLGRSWSLVARIADLRRQGAQVLLSHLIGRAAKGARGKDVQVDTTLGAMLDALNGDALLRADVKDMTRLMDRALLWLHEQRIVTLGRGLTVFRPAITVHLNPKGGLFTLNHFAPLEEHYTETTIQTHVMAAYAEIGLADINRAQKLAEDYFRLDRDSFLRQWLPGRSTDLRRQTTSASWRAIVEALDNPAQAEIVRDDREQTNVLVLAGPGSGKTRVLVHRIAYLVRVRREDPRGILVLTYNRHAAAEVRERLRRLIGEDAVLVTVLTCHALAMRLVGASFAGDPGRERDFDGIVMQAVALLRGDGLTRPEAEALRETLIQGYRWLLVDEYQDIGPEEYALIGAVAGRSLEDPDLKISLFAVGDDDQNIYAFAGASIDFIRRFEADHAAKPVWLTENYRSTGHIIAAANAVIVPAAGRMKAGHDIAVNRARAKEPPGGGWSALDPVAQGRVTLLDAGPGARAQAVAALDELQRLSRLDPDWSWRRCAVIARDWKRLLPLRAHAEALGIPVDMANETLPSLWRLREMQAFIRALLADRARMLGVDDLVALLNAQPQTRWTDLVGEGIGALARELAEKTATVPDLVQWFGEWARSARGEQRGLLLLTAHRSKGLEFDHVAILDGGWDRPSRNEDAEAPRRLFYVAMTRARQTLTVLTGGAHALVRPGGCVLPRRVRPDLSAAPGVHRHYIPADPKLVDLSYAGRLKPGHPALAAIAAARPGDPVRLLRQGDRWQIENEAGIVLGRMSRSFHPPDTGALLCGEVAAILGWRGKDGQDDYARHLHREAWEVVLPELVYTLSAPAPAA